MKFQKILIYYFIFIFVLLNLGCQSTLFYKQSQGWKLRTKWIASPMLQSMTGPLIFHRITPSIISVKNLSLLIVPNPYRGVTAYDLTKGKKIWFRSIPSGSEISATVVDHFVFVAGIDGLIYALNGETGEILWTFPTRHENFAELVFHNGFLYVVTSQNTVYCLEAFEGKQVWIYSRSEQATFSTRGSSRPVVYKNQLIASFNDGFLAALNLKSGKLIWQKELSRNKKFLDLDGGILLVGEQLFVGGIEDAVYSLNPQTGDVIWRIDYSMYGYFGYNQGLLCFSNLHSGIICVNHQDGRIIHQIKVEKGIAGSPVFLNEDVLLFGESQGGLIVYHLKNNHVIAQYAPGEGIIAAPLVTYVERQPWIYVLSNQSYLYAFSLEKKFK